MLPNHKKPVFLAIIILGLIFTILRPRSISAACNTSDERYPLRPYPGEPCQEEVPVPNTIVCANRPLPVGERIYTVDCSVPGSPIIPPVCHYDTGPTVFRASILAEINRVSEAPFTDFAEFDRPNYTPELRFDKSTYLADYLGGSGSVFYDSQPLTPTDPILPSPQDVLDNSSVWQKLTPLGYQENKKRDLLEKVKNDEVHDYVALYSNLLNQPVPRSETPKTGVIARRLSSISPPPQLNCTTSFSVCYLQYLADYALWRLGPDNTNWRYVPAFTLEDSPAFAFLNLDQTDKEKFFIPHLPRITEATREIQQTLSPSTIAPISLPVPAPDSDPGNSDPGATNPLAQDTCDVSVSGYSQADYLLADQNPETQVATWIEPSQSGTGSHGEQIIIRSDFPPDRSRYLLAREPYVKEIWEGLYHNPNAVYRTLLPANSTSLSDPDAKEPADTRAPFSNTSGDPGVQILAGNRKPGFQAKLYLDYFFRLFNTTQEVIKSTNPFGYVAGSAKPQPGSLICEPPVPPPSYTSGSPSHNCTTLDYEIDFRNTSILPRPVDLIKQAIIGQCPGTQLTSEVPGTGKTGYEYVIEKAKQYGYSPAFMMTLWVEESCASDYSRFPVVADVGCAVGVPKSNFCAQLGCALNLYGAYSSSGFSSCRAPGNSTASFEDFMLIFSEGCTGAIDRTFDTNPDFPENIKFYYSVVAGNVGFTSRSCP